MTTTMTIAKTATTTTSAEPSIGSSMHNLLTLMAIATLSLTSKSGESDIESDTDFVPFGPKTKGQYDAIPSTTTSVQLSDSYDPGAFMELLDLNDAVPRSVKVDFDFAKRDALLDVVKRHGQNGTVSVALNHRHFSMDENEILVEQITDGNSSTASVFLREEAPPSLVPYMWVLRNGAFQPYEFMDEDRSTGEVRTNFEALRESKDFLADFAATLERLDAAAVYGLTIQHRGHIAGSTIENNDVVSRKLFTELRDDTYDWTVEDPNKADNYGSVLVAWGGVPGACDPCCHDASCTGDGHWYT